MEQNPYLFQLEKNNIFPDLFLHLQETFPFRDIKLIDMMINKLLNDGLDSIVAAKREINYVWKDKKDKFFTRIDSGDVPRKFKEVSMIGYHQSSISDKRLFWNYYILITLRRAANPINNATT